MKWKCTGVHYSKKDVGLLIVVIMYGVIFTSGDLKRVADTLDFSLCSSDFVTVSAFAMIGTMFTFV